VPELLVELRRQRLVVDHHECGRFTCAMVCAMVKVFPEPVTPSSTDAYRRARALHQLAERALLIAGERKVGDQVEAVV